MNLVDPTVDPLDLRNIRNVLMRLEDTIICYMIERAQIAHNKKLYEPGAFKEFAVEKPGFNGSWLDWFLLETESAHAKVRRYESPDEYPFTPRESLPAAIIPPLEYPKLLHPNNVNVNGKIKDFYIKDILPNLTTVDSDDSNYGSCATRDVEFLQAVSRRIHYGKFVSESKYRSDPAAFDPHIKSRNEDALLGLIFKPQVEAELLKRLTVKAMAYGRDIQTSQQPNPDDENAIYKIDAQQVVRLYEQYIIPLTKEVEVDYLLQRLN